MAKGIAGVPVHLGAAIRPLWGSRSHSYPLELVVAESVVVIKKLLQMQPAQHGEIIKHLAKLTDNIQVREQRHVLSLPQHGPCGFFLKSYLL